MTKYIDAKNKGSFTLSCGNGNGKLNIFPSRMGYIGPDGSVHMETCGNGNGKGDVTNWV